MKLGITKADLPRLFRGWCNVLVGVGGGLILAMGFVSEGERRIFPQYYLLVAFGVSLGGAVLRDVVGAYLFRRAGKASETVR